MDLEQIGQGVRLNLDQKNAAREQAMPLCRRTIRLSANAIRSVHRGEKAEAEARMDEARLCLDEAAAHLSGHPDVRYAGFYHDAEKEYAESRLTYALVFGTHVPGPDEIRVEPAAYLNGLGETIGEMRRHLLDLMRHGHLERSEELLGAMDEMFYFLTSIDHPDAITGGLRRTTDVARSIIERTRGDLSTTIIQKSLIKSLEHSEAKPAP